jgi:predicted AlkP superfamily phosphohydrolase/phosphomutase
MNLFARDQKKFQRVVVLGLDGMPHSLLLRLIDQGLMPHFKALVEQGSLMEMGSVVPTVSSTAWASIVTGCNPGKHGIYGFIDRVPGTYEMFIPTSRNMRQKTWVDLFSGMGRRVFSMGVPTTFPPHAVNGILISGFLAPNLKRATYPLQVAGELEAMGYLIDIDAWQARENREKFLDEIFVALERRIEAMFKYYARESWDLFVAHFMDTDRLHHFLWGDVERGDEVATAWFNRFYARVDAMIGELVSRLDTETLFMIMSDHGFCTLRREVHLNFWLRQTGFLSFESPDPKQLRDLLPQTRCYSLLPGRFYVRVQGREYNGCVQPGSEYEQVRRDVAAGLMEIRDPETSGRVIERVLMREEAFSGEDLDTAPDFMAVPAKGYDLKGGFEKQILLEPSPVNGTHTLDDALWFVNVPNMVCANANVVDVLPTLIDLLGLDAPQSVDGRVIKEGQ